MDKHFDVYRELQDELNRTKTAMVAKAFADCFTKKERDDGTEFYSVSLDFEIPVVAETTRLVREAHMYFGFNLPDDWCYDAVREALITIYDNDAHIDGDFEFASNMVDYLSNSELKKWLYDCELAHEFIDETVSELGHSKDGILGDIATGYFHAYRRVYTFCLEAAAKRAAELIINNGQLLVAEVGE